MKHLLFLAHRIPYPPDKGDKIRSFNELKHLSERGWKIHLCALADDREDLRYVPDLKRYCATVCVEPISPRWQRLTSWKGLHRGLPLSIPYFYSSTLQRQVDAICRTREVRAVFCYSGPMAEYVFRSRNSGLRERLGCRMARSLVGDEARPGVGRSPPARPAACLSVDQSHSPRLIMDLVDVDSDKWAQYACQKRWPMSWVYRMESSLLAQYERRVAQVFDATVLVSDAEADVFRQRTGLAGKIHGIANGVDLDYFCPVPPNCLAAQLPGGDGIVRRLVFCGAMDYYPNVDAVTWFTAEVMPLLRREIGDVEFSIVGARPAKEVLALRGLPGVSVTGRVEDVRPYVWAADVSVAPIRVARGIQNKVLEAMSMAKAVVATPEAFEGIEAEAGRDLYVVKAEPKVYAKAISGLLINRHLSSAMGENARQRVQTHYGWNARLRGLDRLLE